jgi:hypothetical protein
MATELTRSGTSNAHITEFRTRLRADYPLLARLSHTPRNTRPDSREKTQKPVEPDEGNPNTTPARPGDMPTPETNPCPSHTAHRRLGRTRPTQGQGPHNQKLLRKHDRVRVINWFDKPMANGRMGTVVSSGLERQNSLHYRVKLDPTPTTLPTPQPLVPATQVAPETETERQTQIAQCATAQSTPLPPPLNETTPSGATSNTGAQAATSTDNLV